MRYDSRRHELWTLVASIYYFLIYLAAFIIEILLIVDLAKRGDVTLGAGLSTTIELVNRVKSQLALACFALAILYFVVFIASLLPIVALIMRSSICLIIWLYIMTSLYLPEFLLIVYVSVFEWGAQTRTGQIELAFYLVRAIVNIVFLFKANQLYRAWKYENNIFKFDLTSTSTPRVGVASNLGLTGGGSVGPGYAAGFAAAYESPYFIGPLGDSLRTTINPIFSSPHNYYSSTLPIHRNHHLTLYGQNENHRISHYNDDLYDAEHIQALDEAAGQPDYDLGHTNDTQSHQQINNQHQYHQQQHQHELTNNGANYQTPSSQATQGAQQVFAKSNDYDVHHFDTHSTPITRAYSVHNLEQDQHQQRQVMVSQTPIIGDQIVLRPLTHRPFDYLRRPGSTIDLSASGANHGLAQTFSRSPEGIDPSPYMPTGQAQRYSSYYR